MLYLDRLRAYPIKRLASLEGWEAADLLRVLIVLGWDWEANIPRHISKDDIMRRARGEADPSMLVRLASVGWSSKMQDKWRTALVLP